MSDQAATELKLYVDNEAALYPQRVSIMKSLAAKKARGQYRHDLAAKAFGHVVEAGAKRYAKEHGSPGQPWHQLFPMTARKTAAKEMAADFEAEFALGNYDHLLPKKYQKLSSTRAHAHKRGSEHTHLHEPGALRTATDRQLRGFYRDEQRDVARARTEAARRGVSLHARRKRLDREIASVVPSWRGGQ